ncbi:MAG: methyltransferase domain-containing protein [Patescibacteria group bacterium]
MNLQIVKFLLKKTKKDYEKIAEEFSDTRQYLWEDLKEFNQYIQNGDTILDLGCGNGRLFELFNNKKINYFGIDNCEKLIEIAKEKYKLTKVNFFIEDALDLSFEDQKFDVIFCVAVFNHIPSKELRIKVLENIKRVLKKDGILIMTNWNLYQKKFFFFVIKNFFKKIIFYFSKTIMNLDFGDVFMPWKLKDEIIHRYYHAFTMRELSELFKKTGFKVIKKYYTQKHKKTNFWKGHNIIFIAKLF